MGKTSLDHPTAPFPRSRKHQPLSTEPFFYSLLLRLSVLSNLSQETVSMLELKDSDQDLTIQKSSSFTDFVSSKTDVLLCLLSLESLLKNWSTDKTYGQPLTISESSPERDFSKYIFSFSTRS